MKIRYTRDRFLESPETSRAHFGWHNSLCTFKTKASRGTTFWRYFNSISLYNVWKDHLYRISGSEFYGWLFGYQTFRDVRETGPGPVVWVSPNACAHFVPFLSMFNQPLFFPLWLILYNCWSGRLSGSGYSFMLRWADGTLYNTVNCICDIFHGCPVHEGKIRTLVRVIVAR